MKQKKKKLVSSKRKKILILLSFDEILEEEKGDDLFGIFHCFTGTKEQAQQAISYNMKLGIGGVVTFKNGKIDQFINDIDLKHIVLETDSPYLAPKPYRGKRNESSYIVKVLDKLSELYELPTKKKDQQKMRKKITKRQTIVDYEFNNDSKTAFVYFPSMKSLCHIQV